MMHRITGALMTCTLTALLVQCGVTEPKDEGEVDYLLERIALGEAARVRTAGAYFFVYDWDGDPAIDAWALVLVLGDSVEVKYNLPVAQDTPIGGTFTGADLTAIVYHIGFTSASASWPLIELQLQDVSESSVRGALLIEYEDPATGQPMARLSGTFRAVPHRCGARLDAGAAADCKVR